MDKARRKKYRAKKKVARDKRNASRPYKESSEAAQIWGGVIQALETLATVPVTPNQFIKLALNEVNEQELAEAEPAAYTWLSALHAARQGGLKRCQN